MNEEDLTAMLRRVQIERARNPFEMFGRIEKLFVNGGEVKPWHIDSVFVGIAHNMKRISGFTVSRINGVCTLRIAMLPSGNARRKA